MWLVKLLFSALFSWSSRSLKSKQKTKEKADADHNKQVLDDVKTSHEIHNDIDNISDDDVNQRMRDNDWFRKDE